MNPLVSVVIPARNSENTLDVSLKSVLSQSYSNIEVIVIVNGSTDNTLQIANSINDKRLKVVESLPGIVPALNTGLKLSKGKYIARQDADDEWLPGKLSEQIKVLEDSNIDVLGTQMIVKSAGVESVTNYPISHEECVKWFFNGRNCIGHPSVVFRTSLLEKVGGYWEFFPFAEDMDLWLRMLNHAKFSNINSKFVVYNHTHNPRYIPQVPKILSNFYFSVYR